MSHLNLYVPDRLEKAVRTHAGAANLSLSKFLTQLLSQAVDLDATEKRRGDPHHPIAAQWTKQGQLRLPVRPLSRYSSPSVVALPEGTSERLLAWDRGE